MDSPNLSRGVEEARATEHTDSLKTQESNDFEYVSKTDLIPPNYSDSEPKSTIKTGNLNDFSLDSFTSALTDSSSAPPKGSISPEKLSNPDYLLGDTDNIAATLISTADFISAESGNVERHASPYSDPINSTEDVAFEDPLADQGYMSPVSPNEEIDNSVIEKTLVYDPEIKSTSTELPVKRSPSPVAAEEISKPLLEVEEPQILVPDVIAPVKPEAKTPANVEKISKPAVPSYKEAVGDAISEPMELFCKMGLDAWFNPERLHPKVVELVYWRDPKKSGIVLGAGLGVLLSLSFFSLISVIAYLSLLLLTGTILFRIYKNVLQAVQKTSDGHPFKDILDLDLTLPQDKVREVTDVGVAHLNAAALELRRLFLVEDLVDSIKFAVLLWCLTYVGSWFNGMTLIIIGFVAMFTLPKVYENNKAQIDQNLDIVRAKLADISAKVKAAVPIGKKPAVEEKKEQ